MNRTQRTLLVASAITGLLAGVAVKTRADDHGTNAPGANAPGSGTGKSSCSGHGGCGADCHSSCSISNKNAYNTNKFRGYGTNHGKGLNADQNNGSPTNNVNSVTNKVESPNPDKNQKP